MKKLLPRTSKNTKGFTLVELMIAVTIIAVLAVIGVTVYGGVQKSARNSRRQADIEAISKALEARINNKPNENCLNAGAGSYCAPLGTWFAGGAVPTDPSTGAQYNSLPGNGATAYNICAALETSPASSFCRANQQ